MKKIIFMLAALLLFLPLQAIAHHPAADIVDEEIYAMIDSMVADTPHAALVFEEDMADGGLMMIIDTENVTTAEALFHEGLLAQASLLDGEVTLTIEFAPDASGVRATNSDAKYSKWSEWGVPVTITIKQLK